MAMMAIKGIYAPYGVQRLNHGIGFDTAAIELLLPTYGEKLGLKGKIASHWALNPHPALIPAIEAGWVEQIHSFGSEVGMEDYIRARSDVFFTGPRRLAALQPRVLPDRRPLRLRHVHRLDAADRPRRATPRPSPPRASPASAARRTWAPMRAAGAIRARPGCKAGARSRPDGPAPLRRGRKLVVQIVETFRERTCRCSSRSSTRWSWPRS